MIDDRDPRTFSLCHWCQCEVPVKWRKSAVYGHIFLSSHFPITVSLFHHTYHGLTTHHQDHSPNSQTNQPWRPPSSAQPPPPSPNGPHSPQSTTKQPNFASPVPWATHQAGVSSDHSSKCLSLPRWPNPCNLPRGHPQ